MPGEMVTAALIVTHQTATGTGDVRALIDRRDLHGSEVVLVGRSSGTVCVRRLT